jgi:SAM-dependent methyltransferase
MNHLEERIRLLDAIAIPPNSKILDIGAGSGVLTNHLKAKGYDVVPIGIATESYIAEFNYPDAQEMNVEKLMFTDGYFDAVLCSHILEHVENIGLALNEIWRILKPSGWLFCFVPPYCEKLLGGHIIGGWNIGQLIYLLAQYGFDTRNGHYYQAGCCIEYHNVCAYVQKTDKLTIPLRHDTGDIAALAELLPPEIIEGNDGRVGIINWKERIE